MVSQCDHLRREPTADKGLQVVFPSAEKSTLELKNMSGWGLRKRYKTPWRRGGVSLIHHESIASAVLSGSPRIYREIDSPNAFSYKSRRHFRTAINTGFECLLQMNKNNPRNRIFVPTHWRVAARWLNKPVPQAVIFFLLINIINTPSPWVIYREKKTHVTTITL